MKNNLAERLERVLMQDKSTEPCRVLQALKADIRDVLRQYTELSQDITLEIEENENGYSVIMVANVLRFNA